MDHRLHVSDTLVRSFFISYSHQDMDYVKRLAAHLRESGLSAWYDSSLNLGDRYPQKIAEHIRHALGVIVVMSPAAAESEWVEREILEGQRYNRVILPLLVGGERFFLLAATKYFDARLGGLPGDREMRWLRQLAESAEPGRAPAPLYDWGQVAQGSTAAGWQDTEALLAKLHSFLAAGRVEHADILTTTMLVGVAGRIGSGWLRREDSLGWKSEARGATPRYGDFVRPTAGKWPAGFFPTLRNPQLEQRHGWPDRWRETVIAVHLRLRNWSDARL